LLRDNKAKILASLVACMSFVMVSGCSLLPKAEPALTPPLIKPVKPNYELYEVKRGDISKQLKGTATFVPAESDDLSFADSGTHLKSFLVKSGDVVKKGQVVAELETGDLEARYYLQKLDLEKTQILLNQQKQINKEDQYAIQLKTIDTQIAQYQLDLIGDQLNKAKLVSPMDGIVSYISELHSGDSVQAYQTLITIVNPAKLNLVYEATSSNDLVGVDLNMNVELKIGTDSLSGKVIANPLSTPSTLNEVIAERLAKMVVIKPDNMKSSFQMGDQADFVITRERKQDVLLIPPAGLRSFMGRDYVQVLDGESVKEIDVEKGIVTGTEIEIQSGLKEGQMVILGNS